MVDSEKTIIGRLLPIIVFNSVYFKGGVYVFYKTKKKLVYLLPILMFLLTSCKNTETLQNFQMNAMEGCQIQKEMKRLRST